MDGFLTFIVFSYVFNFVYGAYKFGCKELDINDPDHWFMVFIMIILSPLSVWVSLFCILVDIFSYFFGKK